MGSMKPLLLQLNSMNPPILTPLIESSSTSIWDNSNIALCVKCCDGFVAMLLPLSPDEYLPSTLPPDVKPTRWLEDRFTNCPSTTTQRPTGCHLISNNLMALVVGMPGDCSFVVSRLRQHLSQVWTPSAGAAEPGIVHEAANMVAGLLHSLATESNRHCAVRVLLVDTSSRYVSEVHQSRLLLVLSVLCTLVNI